MASKAGLFLYWQNVHVDQRILEAFAQTPRENFVDDTLRDKAYHDHPLPTLRGQSISQPTTIMMMLQALELEPGHNVFEIGAGAGYQASLLGTIVGSNGHVTSAEIIPELVQRAKQLCSKQTNITIIESDGALGVPQAEFDRIIITAACPALPDPLIEQLKIGGIIVAPVGNQQLQTLVKGTKTQYGLNLEFLGQFRFVPLRGKYGFTDDPSSPVK